MGILGCFGGNGSLKFSTCSRSLITSSRVQSLDSCSSTGSNTEQSADDHVDGGSDGKKRYRWEEIESLTMNFNQLIGIGGYSNVYLARFPPPAKAAAKEAHDPHYDHSSPPRLGAVKVYNSSERLNQIVKSEIEISRQVSHPNIVKFLGYSDDKEQGALVFEYISNGTLQDKLHTPPSSSPATILPFQTRIRIAYQLSQALEYLHENSTLNIIHGDIKASNILLDSNFNCKLCDFGFAKMGFASTISPPSSSSSSSSSRMKMMMGSPGYIDPHYLMTGLVSKKSDIYSFGVILLELITGIEAFKNEKMLVSMLRNKKSNSLDMNKVLEMVDGKLNGEFDVNEVKALISIAAVCLHHLPSLRPSATEICQAIRDNVSSIPFEEILDSQTKEY